MTAIVSRWTVPGYREIRELGQGATGTVVLAEHDESSTLVAIKHLSPELFDDPGFREDFRAEAETLATVADANVVRIWEYVESSLGAAIVMDLVDGVELRTMLEEQGPTEPESALWVLSGSLRGLATVHERGVVHRDYKPANVLVDRDGQSLLTDFGIAGRAGADVVSAGTPLYMAPEQWSDGVATVRSDLYAATASFVECLTGRPPYPSGDPAMLRRQHAMAPIPLDDVPEPVRGLVGRGMAKDPARRPADAATFLAELRAAAVTAYGPDWEERGRRRLAERAALLALLFPLAAAPVGATAIGTTTLGAPATAATGARLWPKVLLGAAAAALLVGGVVVAVSGGVPSLGLTTTSSTSSSTGSTSEDGGTGGTVGGGGLVPGSVGGGGLAPGTAEGGGAPAGTAGAGGAVPGAPGAPAGAGVPAPGVPAMSGPTMPPAGAEPGAIEPAAQQPTPEPHPQPTPEPEPEPAPPPASSAGGGGDSGPDHNIDYGGCSCGGNDDLVVK